MATMKTGTICNIRGSNDDWRVIGARFDGLVFLATCKTDLYQLKDWDIWKVFSDAKNTSKIWATQNRLCKSWIERH